MINTHIPEEDESSSSSEEEEEDSEKTTEEMNLPAPEAITVTGL